MKTMYDIEIVDDIRFISKKDIGLFKLVSASNRSAKKDIYDLDYITEEIDIIELFEELGVKQSKFNTEEDKCIFDLDGDPSPIDDPSLLRIISLKLGLLIAVLLEYSVIPYSPVLDEGYGVVVIN